MWKTLSHFAGIPHFQILTDIKLDCKDWINGPYYSTLAALPVIIVWGIWLARNKKLYDGILIPAQVYAGRSFGIFKAFLMQNSHKPPRVISAPIMDDTFPWAFVDGASQGRPQKG